MGLASYEFGGMYSPLGYDVVQEILLRSGAFLLEQFSGYDTPLPPYCERATEFIGRALDLLDQIQTESRDEVITTISALTYAVRTDMAKVYGAPLGATTELAIDAHEGTVLGREAVAFAFADYAAEHPLTG